MAIASGLLPRPMAAMLLGAIGLAGDVSAQMPILSPAQLSDGVMPVRVVCIADSPEAFLRDETFRNRVMTRLLDAVPADKGVDAESRMRALIVPLARRFVVPVGSGFVVDSARRHVVSNWHVVTACTGERAAGRQIGIVEADGGDIVPIEADRLPDRTFQDASGNPVKLVQALCRDKRETCGADLPRGADDKLLTEAVRRRQLDNLLAYAPDLAVLRLHSAARTTPLALALNEQLDDQMRLVINAARRKAGN